MGSPYSARSAASACPLASLGMSWEDMSSQAYTFALARPIADMSQNVAECLADMSARSPTCQRPEGGTDADMSANTDMSSV